MKKLYAFCLALLAASPLSAAEPITFTASNFGRLQPGNNLSWTVLADNQISIPERGENRVWDYSQIQIETFGGASVEQPNNAAFPTADIRIPTLYSFAGYNLDVNQYYGSTNQGYFALGDSYAAATIPGPTAGDTLFVPAQDVPRLHTEMQFPATYGSIWANSPVRYVINAQLKASIFPKAPAQLVQNFTTADTIIGWGTLRLPNNIALEVLLKKQTVTRIDSFYLSGIPAPAFILDQFGLKQGEVTREEDYTFYAENLKGEAMNINYIRRGSSVFVNVYYNSLAPTSVSEPSASVQAQVLPNPAPGGNAVLSFLKTNGSPWSVTVCDMLGREVFRSSVDAPQGEVKLPVHLGGEGAAKGLYLYSIYNDTGVRTASGTVCAE